MTKVFSFALLLLITLTSFAQDYNVYFGFGSDIMRINDIGKLESIIQDFNPDENNILLVGHTDTVGNYEYNLDLSKRRTRSVSDYLIKKGIPKNLITSDYKGKTATVSANQDKNRRVEIKVVSKYAQINSFEELLESMKPQKQSFTIPSDQQVEIEGNKGTLISIPAKSFVDANGNTVSGNITFELTEYYSKSDFISDKLSTVSNYHFIETAGMVNINAVAEKSNKELYLTNEITLSFPKSSDQDFEAFYGNRHDNGVMEWEVAKPNKGTNLDDLGVFLNSDGSLDLTDKAEADNQSIYISYDPLSDKLREPSDEEKESFNPYYKEQEKILAERTKYYHEIKSMNLKYINCDRFLQGAVLTNSVGTFQIDNPDVTLISGGMLFESVNGVIPLNIVQFVAGQFANNIPFAEEPYVYLIGIKDNMPYFWKQKVKLEQTTEMMVHLEKSTFEDIRNAFN